MALSRNIELALLVVALACTSVATAQGMSKEDYRAAKGRIDAEYKESEAGCGRSRARAVPRGGFRESCRMAARC